MMMQSTHTSSPSLIILVTLFRPHSPSRFEHKIQIGNTFIFITDASIRIDAPSFSSPVKNDDAAAAVAPSMCN